eukprot:jgi/Mesvir1/17523/Mv08777-RA.1
MLCITPSRATLHRHASPHRRSLSSLRLEVEEELLLHLLAFSTAASRAALQLSDDLTASGPTSSNTSSSIMTNLPSSSAGAAASSSRHQVTVPASPTVPHRHRDIPSLQATPRWRGGGGTLGAGASSSSYTAAGPGGSLHNSSASKMRTAAASPRVLSQPNPLLGSGSPTYSAIVAAGGEGRFSLDAVRPAAGAAATSGTAPAVPAPAGTGTRSPAAPGVLFTAGPATTQGPAPSRAGDAIGTRRGDKPSQPTQSDENKEEEQTEEYRVQRQPVTDAGEGSEAARVGEISASAGGGDEGVLLSHGGSEGASFVAFEGDGDDSQHHVMWAAGGEAEGRGGGGAGAREVDAGTKVYIERLHISAIDVSLSFVSAPWQVLRSHHSTAAARSLVQAAGFALQRRVIGLAEMEGAPVHLASINVDHPFGDWGALQGMLVRHYTFQALQGLYKVLGSMDFLGDPLGFLRSIRTGVWDFVAKPAKGILSLRPQDLATDVSEGTSSLVRHTVFALSNGASKMSRAARKSLASLLTLEAGQSLQSLRTLDGRRTRRPTVRTGSNLDAIGLDTDVIMWAVAVWEDFKALLSAPVLGARTGGFPGMADGLWLCGVGVFALPAVAALEIIAQTMKATCEYVQGAPERPARVRIPRPLWSAVLPLTEYSAEEAAGWAMLTELGQGLFLSEGYCHCLALAHMGTYIVLTTTHALVAASVARNRRPVPATSRDHWELLHIFHRAEILSVARQGRALAVVALKPPLLASRHRQRSLPARENVALRRHGVAVTDGGGSGGAGARVSGAAPASLFFPLQFVGMELPSEAGAVLLHRILRLHEGDGRLDMRRLPFPFDEPT